MRFLTRSCSICWLIIIALSMVTLAAADEVISPLERSCSDWEMDGKPAVYDSTSLHERINGESELFFSYGFERLVAARYVNPKVPDQSFEVEAYQLGSVLDAFGMFANYRGQGDLVSVGGEGSRSEGQLIFYQDRYLVKLQANSTYGPGGAVFDTCARQIASKLPDGRHEPKELAVLDIAGVVKNSRRYIANSLLGYDFFRRGIVAETKDGGLVFVVLENSASAAGTALARYGAYLRGTDKVKVRKQTGVSGKDPLYGPIHVQLEGRFLIGATRTKDLSVATALVRMLAAQLAKVPALK